MKLLTLARRNLREILRDPLSVCFGIGFPVVLLLLLTAIQANIPVPLFALERLTPGITVFGLSFVSLFSATVLSKDRGSALLQRLYTTPLTAAEFIGAYTLPMLPLSLAQCAVCYLVAWPLGLSPSLGVLYALLGVLPVAVLYVALGLLCGSVLNDKQVGGICGALLTNLTAWLSGVWFDLELVGGVFRNIANALPFVHAVHWERALLAGDVAAALPHLWWVLGYAVAIAAAAVLFFLRQMKKQ